jgi:hypothetical protein
MLELGAVTTIMQIDCLYAAIHANNNGASA